MLVASALCLAGLLVLVVGAELLTRSGTDLARRLGVPPIVIGLTIVAVGTSAPELAVGIEATIQGSGALAVGNIAGTNTVNLLLILGLSALLEPLRVHLRTLKLDLPAMNAAAVALLVMAWDGVLTRWDGLVLVIAGTAYTWGVVVSARRERGLVRSQFAREFDGGTRPGREGTVYAVTVLLGGIVTVVVAADWLIDGATALARLWGVSDAFIGLTIVAIGTSAPELVTTLVSTLKNQRDIAIGNLLGSSVYNIVFILGATCLVPAEGVPVAPELIRIDIPVMMAATLACVPVFMTGRCVSRAEAAGFVAGYALYLGYLLVART